MTDEVSASSSNAGYLTTQQAAEYAGVTLYVLKYYLRQEVLIPDIQTANALLFSRKTLDNWMKKPRNGRGRPRKRPAAELSAAR